MAAFYFVLVAAACTLALANWRWGVYSGLVIDILRDPIRKMSDDHSVVITLAGSAVWAVVAFRVVSSEWGTVRQALRLYPKLRQVTTCLVIATAPAAALTVILYRGGYLVAAVGLASYLGPLLGGGVGFAFARSERDVVRFIRAYSVLNAIALIGTPLEHVGVDHPSLGGIDMEWIRYREEDVVDLVCGIYRSPDIMGLHAAHVTMFSALLAIRARGPRRVGWTGIALWAFSTLLLSGRRKMVGIPLVFLGTLVGFSLWRGVKRVPQLAALAAVGVFGGGLYLLTLWESDSSPEYTQYTDYASTIFTESHTRVNDHLLHGPIETLRQAGILGAGIGMATQGRHYLDAQPSGVVRVWQEDGLSRLLLELGVPGLILSVIAVLLLFGVMLRAMRLVPPGASLQTLQLGLFSVVVGDAASFLISHQQFSGDPVNAMIVAIIAGSVLAIPRIYTSRQHSSTNGLPDQSHDSHIGRTRVIRAS